MSDLKPNQKNRLILDLFQPGETALIVGMFFIGTGAAHYLGGNIDWLRSIIAVFAFLFLLWARNLHLAFWDHPESPICILKSSHPRYIKLSGGKRSSLLTFALLCLTGATVSTFIILGNRATDLPLALLIVLVFLLLLFASMPPFFLQRKGYGEIIEVFSITILIPAAAMLLNIGKLLPLLEMLTVPVLFVFLAAKLIFSLRNYLEDKTGGYPNLLNRLDWEKSMRLHNLLIISAYALIAVFGVIGLSWGLTWPMLLTMPVAAFQVLQILGIMRGGKPNWKVLEWTAGSLTGLMCYLILLTLWLN